MGNADLYILDFAIRSINHNFYSGYQYSFLKPRTRFKIETGVVITLTTNQIIFVDPVNRYVAMDGRGGGVSGGIFTGFELSRKIDTHFYLGLRIRGSYLIDVTSFEEICITPTLTYQF